MSVLGKTMNMYKQKAMRGLGKAASNIAGNVGDFFGGPLGVASFALSTIGDNIKAAQSQFDLEGAKSSMNDYAMDTLRFANQADNTSDILNYAGRINDNTFLDDINNQNYEWDGNLLGGIGALFGVAATERDKQSARDYLSNMQNQQNIALNNAATNVGIKDYNRRMSNYLNMAAFGGPLSTHGSDFSNDLIHIDAGGSHESNPLGGVPAGVDPQGIPNLVEEGEIIWDKDDYVFSDRLKMPKSLVKKYGLGGRKDKSMTFAEGVDKISEKLGSELRPNDPITQRTQDAILGEFEEVQEEKRMQKEQKDIINMLSQLSPEEFAQLMSPQEAPMPVAQEAPVQTGMPPQGMSEGVTGLEGIAGPEMGYAFGGHILDGKHGESKKVTKELAGSVRLPGVGIFAWDKYNYGNTIPIEKTDQGWWVGGGPGIGRLVSSEAEAQRAARQMANARASLNASEELTEPASVTADYDEFAATRKAIDNNTKNAQKAAESVLDADESARRASQTAKSQLYLRPSQRFRAIDTKGTSVSPFSYGTSALNSAFMNYMGHNNYTDITSPGMYFVGVGTDESSGQKGPKPKSEGTVTGAGTRKGSSSTPKLADVKIDSTPLTFNDGIADILAASDADTQRAVAEALSPDITSTRTGNSSYKPLPTWMRYAPIVGGGLSVLSDIFTNPDYSGAENLLSASRRLSNPVSIPVTTIGNRIRRNPFDERLMTNAANQNFLAGLRSTMDTAGGNRAYRQYATSQLVRDRQGAFSDIARNAYLAERQDALQTADFNRATDLYNMNAINQRNLTEAQLNNQRELQGFNSRLYAQNYLDTLRRQDEQLASADLTGFLQSLGNLGNENFIFNQIDARNREGLSPVRYGRDKSGNWYFDNVGVMACGGKKTTKKRRF